MNILILDNSPRRLGTAWFGKWFRQLGCTVTAYHFWRKPRPVALDRFEALVISGSPASVTQDTPWIVRELELIEQADRRGMPVLGVCFGAQLLARAYYSRHVIRTCIQPEFGWHTIHQIQPDNLLFAGLPSTFTAFQFHLEEVTPQPTMQVLACSAAVEVQAFQIGPKPVWGVQFHAEVTPQAGRDLLRKTRHIYEAYGQRYEDLAAQAQLSEAAPRLFSNFLTAVWQERGL
jgi:GMP synthase-like glutamine amidotransferase